MQPVFDSVFIAINKSLSTYDSTSLISKLNRGENVVLDPMFIKVFTKAKEYHKKTNGYLDPTIGDVVNAWGFGSEKKINTIDSTTIDSLMYFTGMDNLQIDGSKLIKKYTKTYLEFNAFAKGYGLDVIATVLDQRGIKNYLIEIGGEIRCKGVNSKKSEWLVGIDLPIENALERKFAAKARLDNQSMATSGNYRKFYEDEKGNKYVHTIDPHTGYPVRSNLLSSIVITEDCMTADAYATAFMAMGITKSKAFLKNNPEVACMLIFSDTI